MPRSRYWKITPDELTNFTYNEQKLLHWEIKCTREPESDAVFFGVFMYRNGTPYDYESIPGIVYYYNNISKDEVPKITKFLHDKYGGKEMTKGDRIFLKDSKLIHSGTDLSNLAKELEVKFNTKSVISLEFEDMSQEELKLSGLPETKLLPIPTK